MAEQLLVQMPLRIDKEAVAYFSILNMLQY